MDAAGKTRRSSTLVQAETFDPPPVALRSVNWIATLSDAGYSSRNNPATVLRKPQQHGEEQHGSSYGTGDRGHRGDGTQFVSSLRAGSEHHREGDRQFGRRVAWRDC